MTRNFIYLINPIAGTKSKEGLAKLIASAHTRYGFSYDIISTVADGNYIFLIDRIRKNNITDIVVCGGDGSINAVAASLMDVNVNIGIIPMGSGDGLARTAGISKTPEKALDTIFTGKSSFINGFYINEHFSCMLCGIGFDAQVAHEFAKQPKRGLKTYIRVTAKNFFTAKPKTFRVKVNNQLIDVKAFFISVANSNQFGNDFKIAPQASLVDDLLDIVIVKGMSKLLLPFSIMGQITGFNGMQAAQEITSKKNIIYFQTHALRIENPDKAMLHIDGDPKETADFFDIKLIKKAFRLIMPLSDKS
ncbi:MAG: YegS/Rv2252/BmrU family lipid kinase [Chitinophagaceae bacterium]